MHVALCCIELQPTVAYDTQDPVVQQVHVECPHVGPQPFCTEICNVEGSLLYRSSPLGAPKGM